MDAKGYYVILLFMSCWLDAISQDSTRFIHLETGMEGIGSTFADKDYFREISNQHTGLFGPRMISQIDKYFAGVKIEKKTTNHKFGFSAGLRFTRLQSTITKSGVPDFFYILLRQTGTTTEYLQLKQLTEISNYLGVPIEVCFYVPGARTFRFYFMAGLEWSYQLSRKFDVKFNSAAMEIYQPDVAKIIGEPDPWYATFYARPGLVIGKWKPVVSFGITLPVVLTNTVSNLNAPIAGAGLQIQYYLPISKRI